MAFGPSMQPGLLNQTVSIMDFALTIAQLLNVSLPHVEAQPIDEILASLPPARREPSPLNT